MGREQPVSGSVRLGEHHIVPNYFEQNQAEALDLEKNVLDTLVQSAPDAKINELKQLLGRMLFSGTAMEKKVSCKKAAIVRFVPCVYCSFSALSVW